MNKIKVTDMRIVPGDASFMIDDGITAVLVDTGFGFTGPAMAQKVKSYMGDRKLEYILMTHSHYDHILGIPCVQDIYPEAKVIGAQHAANILKIPEAIDTMRKMDRSQADICGYGDYEFTAERVKIDIIVNDGDMVNCGTMRFKAIHLPGHTRCSFGFYEPDNRFLIAPETLGHCQGGWNVMPSSWLVGIQMGFDSIDKIQAYDVKTMLAPHCGLLSEEQTKLFLTTTRKNNEESIAYFLDAIKSGQSDADIIESYKAKFRKHSSTDVAPTKAVNLNFSIMLNVIKKEFGV